MPTISTLLPQRLVEVSSIGRADELLKQLNRMASAPSGKVYASQREERKELWRQLLEVAHMQAAALSVAPLARKPAKAKKPTVVPSLESAPVPALEPTVVES